MADTRPHARRPDRGPRCPTPQLSLVPPPANAPAIVAASEAFREVVRLTETFARYDDPVLILGETGTGKEVLARHLHACSRRREQPFVALNCAAIPASLFESELFGHRRGAFTGATTDHAGHLGQAAGGTLLLDEVGELPRALQPKLLRLLQDGRYHRLGDARERQVDVRVIAATNADLERLVRDGRFREDLYYRLAVLEVRVPPLRERPEDIVPLAEAFLLQVTGHAIPLTELFDARSIRALNDHPWPGNVRELQAVVRCAVIQKESQGWVRLQLGDTALAVWLTDAGDDGDLGARITEALARTSGNRSEAARLLGVSRQTLYRWMRLLGLRG